MSPLARLALAVSLGASAGCAQPPAPLHPGPPPNLVSPFAGYASREYKDPSAWLCLPGRDDACASDLDATELLPDGSRLVVKDSPAPAPGADKVDCFYVYPTVDLGLGAANHTSFADLGPMTRTTIAQVARFRTVCRLFVPLYRQGTIGIYLRPPAIRDRYLAVAASDVMDAFVHYMSTFNGGRKIVLIGHSQGAEMVKRLLVRFFDDDPAMRERLLLAFPIGADLDVAAGQTRGGSFAHIPVCSHPLETGCVVGYRSFVAGAHVEPDREPPAAGLERVCVDPAALDRGPGVTFSRTFFPYMSDAPIRAAAQGLDGLTTPFVMLRGFYKGTCVAGPGGLRYLAVSEANAPGDQRVGPVDLTNHWLRGRLGLHILDLQFAQGDLIDLVARRAATLR